MLFVPHRVRRTGECDKACKPTAEKARIPVRRQPRRLVQGPGARKRWAATARSSGSCQRYILGLSARSEATRRHDSPAVLAPKAIRLRARPACAKGANSRLRPFRLDREAQEGQSCRIECQAYSRLLQLWAGQRLPSIRCRAVVLQPFAEPPWYLPTSAEYRRGRPQSARRNERSVIPRMNRSRAVLRRQPGSAHSHAAKNLPHSFAGQTRRAVFQTLQRLVRRVNRAYESAQSG